MDSLLSIVQMPAGVPVGTLAIGRAGAVNAALLAAAILALGDEGIRERLAAYRAAADAVRARRARPRRVTPRPGDARRVHRRRPARADARARGLPLGLEFRFLDPSPEAPAREPSASSSSARSTTRTRSRGWRTGADVVTYEFENVPVDAVAARSAPLPPPRALELGQDRLVEKQLFRRLGIPTARFGSLDETGLPALVKTRRLGYDGKGQRRLDAPEPLGERRAGGGDRRLRARALDRRGARPRRRDPLLAARRERAPRRHPARLARAGGALRRRPRPRSSPARLLDELGYVGVLALELFEVDGRLLANEFAPRVHNTGHWTIDGAVTSQFENHLRAILGLPLGSTEAVAGVGDGEPDRRRPAARRAARASRARTSTSTARSRGRGARSGTSRSSAPTRRRSARRSRWRRLAAEG